jgi:endonuclease YncB( thermonuclease family)
MKPLLRILVFVLALLAGAAHAGTWRGVVSHVTDGDTLWVRPDGQPDAVEIRIIDIDAPESCQAFGPQAKKALAARLLYQPVVVHTEGYDDYGRHLAQLKHRDQDVGAWLVREGYAWSGVFHRKRGPYAALEDDARRAHLGLWANPKPQEPRAFRQQHGSCL